MKPVKTVSKMLLVVAGLMLGILICLMPQPARADNESAMVYLKKAREQARKKEYTSALETFQKGIAEAPDLPDLYYERGLMLYQIKEMSEAIIDFAKADELLKVMASLTKPQEEMKAKIASYQAEYDKLKEELDGINSRYVSKLLDFVDKYPDFSENYLSNLTNSLAALEPNNAEVAKRCDKIRQNALARERGLMLPLFNGQDLKDWDTTDEAWQVEDGVIIAQNSDILHRLKHTIMLKNNYTISLDIKIDEMAISEALAGLGFAVSESGNKFYMFTLAPTEVGLLRYVAKEDAYEVIKRKPLPATYKPDGWNNLTIKIEGGSVSCYLNNELVCDATIPEENRSRYRGLPALLYQGCKVRFKDILYLVE